MAAPSTASSQGSVSDMEWKTSESQALISLKMKMDVQLQ
jgi:hypothetical protein